MNPEQHPKILLIDVDGTLVDSFPGIRDSFLYALDNNGISRPPQQEIARIPGPPMSQTMANLGLEGEVLDATLRSYLEHQAGGGWSNAHAFPGMKKLLARWRKQGIILSTATSKSMESAQRILTHFGMLPYFHVLAAADPDTGRQGKAMVIDYALTQLNAIPEIAHWRQDTGLSLDPGELLLIGDRIHDVEGASAHGIASVLVSWGYGDEQERAQANACAASPEELDHCVQRWFADRGQSIDT
ncbi:HAD hydrolase-like protein [Corynebacterium anserum]|uniref:HAD hydrolase-like protein n=1 Tax=Corynebacterium anserum TaxID=2684406 RepID=A0A7G7YMS3_9CORY|nr:HAD hydrolase-like protein [Corynebacterium anserum]QNH95793.1 HAD hydrolase-like protein [Corynebacterium anserum]